MSVALRRVASRSVMVAVLAVGLWLGAVGRAWADPLNPLDFTPLGAFPTAVGFYTINTSGTPTLTEPNGTILTGVVSHGIAVFDFDSINVLGPGSGLGPPIQVFTATGSLPLALLSRTNATIAGTIDGSGQGTTTASVGGFPTIPGGPGGGNGALFPPTSGGPGGGGNGVYGPRGETGGGGGGFGGPGGAGASSVSNIPGGLGGAPYGDLARQLQGGSGGGASIVGPSGASFGPSGGGGGAIEIGAVGPLTISGNVIANGGTPFPSPTTGGGGGGSGGGILLHADSVRLTGSLSAVGGAGGSSSSFPGPGGFPIGAGGGGGGGRVTILSGPGGFVASGATIDVAGGAGGAGNFISANGSPGGAGVLVISAVPAPASLVLLGIGVLGLLGLGGMRRRATPA